MAFLPTITDINVYSSTLVNIELSDEVLVDDAYYDITNYTLSDGLTVTKVLELNDEVSASLNIILVTAPMIMGTQYTVTIDGIRDKTYKATIADGVASGLTGDFQARVTKLDSILRSIPSHYDKRNTSLIHAIMTAISVSDDIIGGSRNDSITFS